MQPVSDVSPQRWARTGGGLYLVNIVLGFFAIGFVPSALIVSGDAAATAHNILSNELLYRSGLIAHMIVLLTNVPLAVIFYDLLCVARRRLSLFVVLFTILGTAVESVVLLYQFEPLVVLNGSQLANAFSTQQLQALAYTPIQMQEVSFNLPQVFYSFYLVSAGYAIFRSTFFPRGLGVTLTIGGAAYLTNSFMSFLVPGLSADLTSYLLIPGFVAEASFCLWLLVKGVNVQRWKESAAWATTSQHY